MTFYSHTLNPTQNKILPQLTFTKPQFYLGGGTALTLQLGHRTSVDFDFYAPPQIRQSTNGANHKSTLSRHRYFLKTTGKHPPFRCYGDRGFSFLLSLPPS